MLKVLAKKVIFFFLLRKHNRELKVLNEKIEKLSYIKERFFSNMSHELSTPLNAICCYSEILNYTKLDKEQKEILKIIRDSLDILVTIINDILDYSKIETENLKIEKYFFDLRILIKSIYELLIIKSNEKCIKLEVDINHDVPSYINVDRVRLNQILMNLLGNAIKFTDKGSVILKIELLGESDEDVDIKFSVKDTGVGIAADKCNEIFERFHQLEETTRKFGRIWIMPQYIKESA